MARKIAKKAPGKGKAKVEGMDTGRFPAERVSWDKAVEFCRRLSEMPEEKKAGRNYRLPTEAEWEYACRGGATSYTLYHFGNHLAATQANFNSQLNRTTAVGSYPANAWGLFDMHGNVWEWCQDWYDEYDLSVTTDPQGPRSGTARVLRGGSWGSKARGCRAACRNGGTPGMRNNAWGFRVVLRAEA